MTRTVYQYVLGQLSSLTDEELACVDFDAGILAINDSQLDNSDAKKIKDLFIDIQKQIPIAHHGVLGMKWGQRKYQNRDGSLTAAGKQRVSDNISKQSLFGKASKFEVRTRNGESITAEPIKPLSTGKKILNALLGVSEKDELGRRGDANYVLSKSDGEKIGELSLISKNSNSAYIDWITVDETQRGKGIASDVINDLIIKAKNSGYSTVEMNALKKPRPLYERLGFTYTDTSKMSIMDRISGFEFGTKRMEYDLSNFKHSNNMYIAHYGIIEMKWGRRKVITQSNVSSKNKKNNHRGKELVSKGVKIASNLFMYNLVDDVFYGGAGKQAIKVTGRIAVTAFLKANGHKNIRWYD